MASDLVNDSKLTVRFADEYTCHSIFESHSSPGQRQVRRRRKEERWKREKLIGKGGFGSVWLERCLASDNQTQFRAVKMIPKAAFSSDRIDYTRELEAIAKFSQEKYTGLFVKSLGWYEDASLVYIAMEYLELGDLQTYLSRPLPEKEALQITSQILEGLEQLHGNGFAHRDLKPANIFVVQKAPDRWIKIGDFGISKRVNDGQTVFRTTGFQYTHMVDMWSLGVMTHYMLTRTLPFKDLTELWVYVKDCRLPSSALSSRGASLESRDFVKRLMAPNPASRLCAGEALRHEWLSLQIGQQQSDDTIRLSKAVSKSTIKYLDDTQTVGGAGSVVSTSLQSEEPSGWWSALDECELYEAGEERIPSSTSVSSPFSDPTDEEMQEYVVPEANPFTTRSRHRAQTSMLADSFGDGNNSASAGPQQNDRVAHYHSSRRGPKDSRSKNSVLEQEDTFSSVHDKAISLIARECYQDAELVFRQAVEGRMKSLGYSHKDTLESMFWVGFSLFHQKQYQEAQRVLQPTVEGQVKALGHTHTHTLDSMFWLGCSLVHQGQYQEAQLILQQALEGQVKTLGYMSPGTIRSRHWLGYCLYKQRRYQQAEVVFEQVLQERMQTLGQNHPDTVECLQDLHKCQRKRGEEANATRQQALEPANGQEEGPRHDPLPRDKEETVRPLERSRVSLGHARHEDIESRRAARGNSSSEESITDIHRTRNALGTENEAEDLSKPVYLKGLFNVSTTSSKPLPVIRADIFRVLKLLSIDYAEMKGGFSCRAAPPDSEGKLGLQFEVLIVKVPLFSLHGIQLKKVSGETWFYRETAQGILNTLKL